MADICDGSHGRFCVECASINRWSDKSTPIVHKHIAYTWALKGPLKDSDNKVERSWRFQTWWETSPYYGRDRVPPEAWREYRRQLSTVVITR